MYNAKQKEQFLNSVAKENSYRSYVTTFSKSERFEESFGKDVANMSLDEILILLDMISGKSAQSIANCRSLLSNYVDWCIRNGKSELSENNISKISYKSVDKKQSYRSSYIKSDEELMEMLNSAFPKNVFDFNEDLWSIRQSIVLLIYMGFEKEEIMYLKKQHVDYENGIIQSPIYPDIVYSADPDLLQLLKYCSDMEEIEYDVSGKKRVDRLCVNDYIYRAKVGKSRPIEYDGTVASTYIWKRVDELNEAYYSETGNYKKVTPSSLMDSKKFYEYYLTDDKEGFLDNLKVDLSIRTKKNDRQLYISILNFKRDFEMWEKTFY